MMIKLINGDEVRVGERTYRVVCDELFMVVDKEPSEKVETQLDRIERRLDELEKTVEMVSYPPYSGVTTTPPYPATTWITCADNINDIDRNNK